MDGAVILDKPAGITSHDAVAAARRILGERRIGHLGTLDPFATGVLVLLVGRATRLARFYRHREKAYQGIIRFGFSTDTMDSTGRALAEDRCPPLNEDDLRRDLSGFVGPLMQRPPNFSAKKIAGVPAYRLARKGQAPEIVPVPVTVHEFDLLWIEGSRAGFRARVSSGTYVRALVHDLGERTGLGAHLESLRRPALGEFSEKDSLTLEPLHEARESALIALSKLLPDLPAIVLDDAAATMAVHGRRLVLDESAEHVRLFDPERVLIRIAESAGEHYYHPRVVLTAPEQAMPTTAR